MKMIPLRNYIGESIHVAMTMIESVVPGHNTSTCIVTLVSGRKIEVNESDTTVINRINDADQEN